MAPLAQWRTRPATMRWSPPEGWRIGSLICTWMTHFPRTRLRVPEAQRLNFPQFADFFGFFLTPRTRRAPRRGAFRVVATLVPQVQLDRHVPERQVIAQRLDQIAKIRLIKQL